MRKHWTGVMKEVGCHLIEDREAEVLPVEVKKLGSRAVAVAGNAVNAVVAERDWESMTLNSERIDVVKMKFGQRRPMTVVEVVATVAVAAAEVAAVERPRVPQAVPDALVQSILVVAES